MQFAILTICILLVRLVKFHLELYSLQNIALHMSKRNVQWFSTSYILSSTGSRLVSTGVATPEYRSWTLTFFRHIPGEVSSSNSDLHCCSSLNCRALSFYLVYAMCCRITVVGNHSRSIVVVPSLLLFCPHTDPSGKRGLAPSIFSVRHINYLWQMHTWSVRRLSYKLRLYGRPATLFPLGYTTHFLKY